jgi:hypothetical protein
MTDVVDNVPQTIADGRYFWKLIFHYANTDNPGEIKTSYKYTKLKKVRSEEFLSHKFNISTAFTYNNKSSVTLQFEGLGDGSQNVEYNIHAETGYELQNTSETDTEINESVEETREYTIGGGGVLDLYQLCYETVGVSVETDTFSTEPLTDIIVKLKFACHKHILGLQEILDGFSHTRPRSENTEEWKEIRDSIVKNSALPELMKFKRLVETLGGIKPRSSNIAEWQAIRTTCQEILEAWDQTDMQRLFNKLLQRFSITVPGSSNKEEWQAIRGTSDRILNGLKELSWGETMRAA